MRILIVGFQEYETLDNIMQKLIESGQCYIFTVLCGGCEYSEEKSLAEQWAINNGAPIEYIYEKDVDKLVDKITKSADYLVAQSGSYFSDWIIRKMKSIGKHGSVV